MNAESDAVFDGLGLPVAVAFEGVEERLDPDGSWSPGNWVKGRVAREWVDIAYFRGPRGAGDSVRWTGFARPGLSLAYQSFEDPSLQHTPANVHEESPLEMLGSLYGGSLITPMEAARQLALATRVGNRIDRVSEGGFTRLHFGAGAITLNLVTILIDTTTCDIVAVDRRAVAPAPNPTAFTERFSDYRTLPDGTRFPMLYEQTLEDGSGVRPMRVRFTRVDLIDDAIPAEPAYLPDGVSIVDAGRNAYINRRGEPIAPLPTIESESSLWTTDRFVTALVGFGIACIAIGGVLCLRRRAA